MARQFIQANYAIRENGAWYNLICICEVCMQEQLNFHINAGG
jgi:hypothetical protein